MPHRPHNFRALSKPKQIRKNEHRHYWPYLPVLLLVIVTILVGILQPARHRGVLSYATSMSGSALLDATNSQREQNGASDLRINSQLMAAAQAKAKDMIARNYWSHTTPTGEAPWVFIDNAGYKYFKAGENLAYGFTDSNSTVTGWMNSASHRENLLDKAFTEVGFGYANGGDYNHNGAETVVVAMYGQPQTLAVATPAGGQPALKSGSTLTVNTDQKALVEPATQNVALIQTLTGGKAPWTFFAIGLTTGLLMMFLLFKHATGLRHLIKDSERFVLRHALLDTILVSCVLLGSFLSQTSGFIR
ncbi:MAG TPA: CAP domain-containing protein [Candidatus Saccharimonadales bacterium]|nr:CAP domain-containing protein [Candidatus Saccharimonadales bacterium]